MDNKPTEDTPKGDVVTEPNAPEPTTEEVPTEPEVTEEPSENSPSTEEDLTPLIEAERKRGVPDPEKARERFLASRSKNEEEDESEIPDEDRPLTKREAEALFAERVHQAEVAANADRIIDISESLAESPKEAELIREIHKNRTFPAGMSIRDQLEESKAIANVKRTQAKNAELARKVQSQQTATHNTATTQRDPQAGTEPKLAADIQASVKRAGYTFNNQMKRYEKKLPNGKTLAMVPGQPPYPVD